MSRELKRVLNLAEATTDRLLRAVSDEHGARVFAKVRLADVLPIEGSGVPNDWYSFALKGHFDFLVTDADSTPQFAVEFDGPTHQDPAQQHRDGMKDALCDRFGLPMLRVKTSYFHPRYGGKDLLSWFVKAWFLERAFDEYQEHRPWDPEPFIPWAVRNVSSDGKVSGPLDLGGPARIAFMKLQKAGKLVRSTPDEMVAVDDSDNMRGAMWVELPGDAGVYIETGIRSQRFPLRYDALQEILPAELRFKLDAVLEGREQPLTWSEVARRARSFRDKYRPTGAEHFRRSIDSD